MTSEFKKIGYVVVNEREEFLLNFNFKRGNVALVWSQTILNTFVFPSKRAAKEVIERIKTGRQLWVFELLDNGPQLALSSDDYPLPSWFNA